jgi:hypothetical protein
MAVLCRVETAARRLTDSIARAITERRTGFSDYEAGDFLAGRMECDGPDAADVPFYTDGGPTEWLDPFIPKTPAPPAGEQPPGVGSSPTGAGAAAPILDERPRPLHYVTDGKRGIHSGNGTTSDLFYAAANQLAHLRERYLSGQPDALQHQYLGELIPELRDRAAQYEAIQD